MRVLWTSMDPEKEKHLHTTNFLGSGRLISGVYLVQYLKCEDCKCEHLCIYIYPWRHPIDVESRVAKCDKIITKKLCQHDKDSFLFYRHHDNHVEAAAVQQRDPPHLPLTQFAVDVFDGFITRSRFLCGSHTWLTCSAGGRIKAKGGVMSHQFFRKVVDDLVGLFFVGPTDMYLCIYIYSQHLKQKELGNIYFYWILQPFPVPFRWNHGGSLENHQFEPHDVHEGLKWRGFKVAMFSSLEITLGKLT